MYAKVIDRRNQSHLIPIPDGALLAYGEWFLTEDTYSTWPDFHHLLKHNHTDLVTCAIGVIDFEPEPQWSEHMRQAPFHWISWIDESLGAHGKLTGVATWGELYILSENGKTIDKAR